MAQKRGRKLLWAFTIILVAAAILLGVFTFRTPLASAHGSIILHCEKEDKATLIYPCDETIPGHQKGTEIPKECVQDCKRAGGIPATFGKNSTQLYCAEALQDFKCGATEIFATPTREPPNPVDATQLAETIKEKEASAEKECGALSLGCWFKKIFGLILTIGTAILDAVVGSIAALMKFLSGLLQSALNQVIGYFVSIPVSPSNSDAPEFVRKAWDFTRTFANNFFILILAFIGLATILRLQAYQLQKTLPVLLLVALLVNFSGVLVGLVADVGNIITTYFLGLAADPTWSTKDIPSFGGTNASAKLGLHIVEIIYYLISSLVYFAVMLVFALRTIALWTLSIVSPIAFALYILPATRRFFNDWWKQLIQWSFMGIPVAFFIFLASTVLQYGATPKGITAPGALADFLAPFTTLFLLFTGITMSMAMAPAAAQGAINLGKKWGIQGAMGFGSAVSRKVPLGKFGENMRKRGQGIEVAQADKTRLERWGGAVLGKVPGMDRLGSAINVPVLQKRRDETQARIDELEAKKRKNRGRLGKKDTAELEQKKTELQNVNAQISTASAGWATQGVARFARRGATVFGRGMELAGKEIDMRTGAKDEREYQQGVKDVGDKDSFHVFNMVNEELAKGPLANWNRVVGMLNGVRNRGDGDDIEDALKSGQLNRKVIGQAIKQGRRMGPPGFRPLLKSFYSQAMLHPEEFGFNAASTRDEKTGELTFTGRDASFLAQQYKSVPTKFNAQDFQGDTIAPINFDMNTQEGRFFAETIVKTRGADFMGQIGRRPRKEESRAIMEYIFKEGRHAQTGLGIDWLLDNNAEDVLRYLDSPGARSLGLGRNITREQIEEKIALKKGGQTTRDFLEQSVQLEQERAELTAVLSPTPRERRRLNSINREIEKIEVTLNLMDEKATPTQRLLDDAASLQSTIDRATQAIKQDETNLENYRDRVGAERELGPLRQELNRRGITIPTTQEQTYNTFLEQRTQQQTQLQNLQQELKQHVQKVQSRTGVFLPIHQQRTQEIQREIQQTTQQLEQTEQQVERMEVELGRVPEPLAPLPTPQPNMPDPLKRLIEQGRRERNTVVENRRELQANLANIRESQEDLTEITQTMARLTEQANQLSTPELQGEIQSLTDRERVLSQQINEYRGLAAKAREEILTSKQKVDGPDGIRERIGAQTELLQRKYESTQRSQRRDQRLKQR